MSSMTLTLPLYVLAPPEAADYARLLADVLGSIEYPQAKKIAKHVHFVFFPIDYASGLMIPMRSDLSVALVFRVPCPKDPPGYNRA